MSLEAQEKVAIIGGGPSALYLLKHFYLNVDTPLDIHIFEKQNSFGLGMPYSLLGACQVHVANISANEIPTLFTSFNHWYLNLDREAKSKFPTFESEYTEDLVIPRLLLGQYLSNQFDDYFYGLKKRGFSMTKHAETLIVDITQDSAQNQYKVITSKTDTFVFDAVIICTGHMWEKLKEDKISNWFDSPYPPSKLKNIVNKTVAIKGASLTAVDALKTLARNNGKFIKDKNHELTYVLNPDCSDFYINIFTLDGLLPAQRFYSPDTGLEGDTMEIEEINSYKEKHQNFVDLNYVYKEFFLKEVKEKDPPFYNEIKDLDIKAFIAEEMQFRKSIDSISLLQAEHKESTKSKNRHRPIAWKKALIGLSYAINYPAKHFNAEDMIRLKKELMPLISIIIAALPESSYFEIMALYKAGVLEITPVDKSSYVSTKSNGSIYYHYKNSKNNKVEKSFDCFIDATGQKAITLDKFPFKRMVEDKLVARAYLPFKNAANALNADIDKEKIMKTENGDAYLYVSGLEINDYFQLINPYGEVNPHLFCMSVPFISGLNPDYSGLDFCDTAAEKIVSTWLT